MQRYIIRRLLLAVVTFFGVCILVFCLVRLIPGDVATYQAAQSEGSISAEELRESYGLNKPVWEQYVIWQGAVLRGDFGVSMISQRPVLDNIFARVPLSLEMAILATIISVLWAIPIGTLSAMKQDTRVDYFARIFAIAGISLPGFWVGMLLLLIPSLLFHYAPPFEFTPFFTDPWRNLQQLAFPVLALGFGASGSLMRMTRSSVLEVMRQDYVKTARSKGLRERVTIIRHVLRNGLIPVTTIVGLELAMLVGGVVIMEKIFNLPGIGLLLLDSVTTRDYTQLQGTAVFIASVVVFVNLVVDLSYGWLDPRIRYD